MLRSTLTGDGAAFGATVRQIASPELKERKWLGVGGYVSFAANIAIGGSRMTKPRRETRKFDV